MQLLVIGGNGFVGSAICKSAIARGWQVISLSRSGTPFITPNGYTPNWVNKVEWRKGSPFSPETYTELLPSCTAVVSTLGILFESDYKSKERQVNPMKVLKNMANSLLGDTKGNPLKSGSSSSSNGMTYERMNRDAALASFRAFAASAPKSTTISPFVYLSAEDIFRPFVSSRYIETKRETERIIQSEIISHQGDPLARQIRPLFIRPSLIYHPILNPLTTLPATALSASSHLQSVLPVPLRLANLFATSPPLTDASTVIPPVATSLASLLTIPPIHVDTIGEAVCMSIEDESARGVIGVKMMRKLLKYDDVYDQI